MDKLTEFLSKGNYSDKTKEMLSWLLNKIKENGYSENDLYNCSIEQLREMLISVKPTSLAALSAYCSLLAAYFKWINKNLIPTKTYEKILDIDRRYLWSNIRRETNIKRYLSYKQFETVISDIEKYEEYNVLYYQTLFRAIYEGIYNENLTVLSQLKISDIVDSSITIHSDEDYSLKISDELIKNLELLSKEEYWISKHKSGNGRKVRLIGDSEESCFKITVRQQSYIDFKKAGKFFYYQKLRKIAEEYLDYPMQPMQLYISGIMYRVCQEIQQQDIRIEDAFDEYNHNAVVYQIIQNELNRVHYNIRVSDFKFRMKDYLDVFI